MSDEPSTKKFKSMSSDLAALAQLKSWVSYDAQTDFPIQNLPYGVFTTAADSTGHIGVAIGNMILDLNVVAEAGLFSQAKLLNGGKCFKESSLNELMSLGKQAWSEARSIIQQLLLEGGNDAIRTNEDLKSRALVRQVSIRNILFLDESIKSVREVVPTDDVYYCF